MPRFTALDHRYMKFALHLAHQGWGQTRPNPSVGAVVVTKKREQNVIIGAARTANGGRPHAETQAIKMAGLEAKGSTLYVTLEPCDHHGLTPPCTDAIISAGINRVVVGALDPDERVAGVGIARLRKSGISVETGCLEEEAYLASAGHFLSSLEDRPFVTVKLAVGSDGLIAPGDGRPVWVTGEQARKHGALLRAKANVIMIGRGTLAADDPLLTCRLPGLEHRSPVRAVLDKSLSISMQSQMVKTTSRVPLMIFCGSAANANHMASLRAKGIEVIPVSSDNQGFLDLKEIFQYLASENYTRILVEGGPRLAGQLMAGNFVDRLFLYQGQSKIGKDGILPFGDKSLGLLKDCSNLNCSEQRMIGRDRLSIWQKDNLFSQENILHSLTGI